MTTPRKRKPGTFGTYPRAMARDPRMTAMARCVVLLIETYPPETPISTDAMAELLDAGNNTIKRAITCAKACGYLAWKPGGMTRQGRRANRYKVLFPDLKDGSHRPTSGPMPDQPSAHSEHRHRPISSAGIGPPVGQYRESHESESHESDYTHIGRERAGAFRTEHDLILSTDERADLIKAKPGLTEARLDQRINDWHIHHRTNASVFPSRQSAILSITGWIGQTLSPKKTANKPGKTAKPNSRDLTPITPETKRHLQELVASKGLEVSFPDHDKTIAMLTFPGFGFMLALNTPDNIADRIQAIPPPPEPITVESDTDGQITPAGKLQLQDLAKRSDHKVTFNESGSITLELINGGFCGIKSPAETVAALNAELAFRHWRKHFRRTAPQPNPKPRKADFNL
jgi:hypothetical protein